MRYWTSMPPALRGVILMVLSTVGFAVMHALVRYVSSELHPFQIAFFRNAFGFLIFLPWFLRYGVAPLRTRNFPLHGLRAVLNCLAMFAFFTGLSLTPIAQVTALAFTAPIFAAVLGVFLLRERVHLRRWSAIGVGFAGTLVVLRPGFQAVDLGSSLVLVSALLWAATMIVIKVLGRTESSMTITCYMNLLLTGLSLLPALFVWQAPSPAAWFWLLLIGLLGTAAQIALAQSLKEAETSVVMPFDFLKLIWTAALGYWLFSEVPDIFVWIGGAIIFASSVYIAYRESRVSKGSGIGGLDGPVR
jgi:drug/metabolite transporter (DMT)-like permease